MIRSMPAFNVCVLAGQVPGRLVQLQRDAKVIALPKWNLRGFAVDGRGRMWFAHGDGLTVLDATGKKLKLPRALARSDEMHSIFVEGNGPDF